MAESAQGGDAPPRSETGRAPGTEPSRLLVAHAPTARRRAGSHARVPVASARRPALLLPGGPPSVPDNTLRGPVALSQVPGERRVLPAHTRESFRAATNAGDDDPAHSDR